MVIQRIEKFVPHSVLQKTLKPLFYMKHHFLIYVLPEVAIEENLKHFLLVLSVSLSVATLQEIFSWFRKIPYTLLLVIVGLGLALVDVRLGLCSKQGSTMSDNYSLIGIPIKLY